MNDARRPTSYGRRAALKTALLYALLGALWIFLSDQFLSTRITDAALHSRLQTLKGWGFIGVTSVILYLLALRRFAEFQQAEAALKESEARFREEASHASSLGRVAARLNANLDPDTMLGTICEEVGNALDVPIASVCLYDKERDAHYSSCEGEESDAPGNEVKSALCSFSDRFARHRGLQVTIDDVRELPDQPEAQDLSRCNVRSVVCSSMMRGGERIGILNVATLNERRQFTSGEEDLLRGLADQAAQALANARLFEEAERRYKHIQALREIDLTIAASLDLRVTLNVVIDQVISQLHVDAGDILLLDAESGALTYAAGRGFQLHGLSVARQRVGEGIAGSAVRDQEIKCVEDLRELPEPFERSIPMLAEGFMAYYAVPLLVKGQVKGVLEIMHRAPLAPDPEWLSFLEALSAQAAIAVDNAMLFDDLQRTNIELALAHDITLEGWIKALDLRDKETEGHTQRVTDLALRLAIEMERSDDELVHIRRGALLHDIGKIGIPDSILHKPGPLTAREWEIMRRHPVYANELISLIGYLRPALDIPYCHHEKWDGSGYPNSLKAEEIPLAARIFAVVDVWDALCSDRPYRKGWPMDRVKAYIRDHAGTHFDPAVVEVFLRMIEEQSVDEGLVPGLSTEVEPQSVEYPLARP